MARMFADIATQCPDAPALIDDRGSTTWAAFDQRTESAALAEEVDLLARDTRSRGTLLSSVFRPSRVLFCIQAGTSPWASRR